MNFVEAVKAAQAQGKEVVELRFSEGTCQYTSFSKKDIGLQLISAYRLQKKRLLIVDPPGVYNSLALYQLLSERWYPSETKRQTLLDIQSAKDHIARFK